ncbi:glycosyltransferase [Flavobacteriales bacterium]|nr:glycosyltransferase [Flavobacteriales bacterium]
MENILVSTALISYNQEQFVRQALNGITSQKIEGTHEIVCGDDASKDNTPSIITEFAQDPRIRILNTESNLGMHKNWARTIEACTGKYIAICEGDDVWIDPEKLQKQINLLEQSPKASACFSNANVIDNDGNVGEYLYVNNSYHLLEAEHFFELNFNPIPTCTVVFRKSALTVFPDEYYSGPFADWVLHTLLIQTGPYIYLPEVTSSYRQHAGGVWTGIDEKKQLINKLKAIEIIQSLVSPIYVKHVKSALLNQLDKLLYFYRDQKDWGNYFSTWIKLKMQ